MPVGIQRAFLALVLVQGVHSLEEYRFRLYEVFAPARFVSGLVSDDLRQGFIIANLALFAFGMLCYLGPVRRGWRPAAALVWAWTGIELVNGIVHPAWSLIQRSYTPGVATAPLLLALALYLAVRMVGRPPSPAGGKAAAVSCMALSVMAGVAGVEGSAVDRTAAVEVRVESGLLAGV